MTVHGSGGVYLTTPPSGGAAWGGMGGQLILPPFDCSDPDFFPLRLGVDSAENQNEGGAPAEPDVPDDLTVLLVFDKSGSMSSPWGGKSRWQAGSDAVLLGLDGILDALTIGAIFFPFDEAGTEFGCGVPGITVAPQIDFDTGRAFKSAWIEGACSAQPDGSTPLERAFLKADEAITQAEERSLIRERMRVILVTDGEPTCGDSLESIVAFPRKWSERGIETHVIGLPGSSGGAELLTQIAQAGGTEDYFAPAGVGAIAIQDLEEEVHHLLR